MIASVKTTTLTQRIEAEFEAGLLTHPASTATRTQRRQQLDRALAAGLPSNRDEGFRYAQLRPLERLAFSAAPMRPDADERAAALVPPALPGFDRLVFVDGHLCASLCSDSLKLLATSDRLAYRGITLGRSTTAADFAGDDPAGRPGFVSGAAPAAVAAGRRFAIINAAFANEQLLVDVAENAGAVKLELVFVGVTDGKTAASYPRISLRAAPRSQLQLVERHLGATDAASFSNSSVQLQIAAQANCSHYRLQSQGQQAAHIETLQVRLQTGAHYELHQLQVGAAAARSTIGIELAGANSSVAVHAAQVASGTQVQDAQVTIEHRAPATTTTETFRGLASGRGRIAFNGHMIVRESAPGANTRQSLRCLLAGPDTEGDVRPQLEIYTDDVRASHGATVGKLDENMLFYLLSRGIDRDTAQSLLKWAFMAEVLTRIDIAPLRQEAQALVLGRVQGLIGEALS